MQFSVRMMVVMSNSLVDLQWPAKGSTLKARSVVALVVTESLTIRMWKGSALNTM